MASQKYTSSEYSGTAKIILLGETGCGKSSLVDRYADDKFVHTHITTIGIDYVTKIKDVAGKKYKVQIWDTSGQERFRSITKMYYKNAQGVMFVFDLCNLDSFDRVKFWMNQINNDTDITYNNMILVGSKYDDSEHRLVPYENALTLAREHNIPYYETSALDGTNVNAAFEKLIKTVINNNIPIPNSIPNTLTPLKETPVTQRCQCILL